MARLLDPPTVLKYSMQFLVLRAALAAQQEGFV